MILTFLLNAIYSFITFTVSLLPVGSLPAPVSSAFIYIVSILNSFNYIFPIDTLFQVLTAAIILELAFIAWNFTYTFMRYLRGN